MSVVRIAGVALALVGVVILVWRGDRRRDR
jgi:hypothetical protein